MKKRKENPAGEKSGGPVSLIDGHTDPPENAEEKKNFDEGRESNADSI